MTDWARQEDASWMKLARALDQMNETHIAEEIRRQYLSSPEHEDDSMSTVAPSSIQLFYFYFSSAQAHLHLLEVTC